MGGENVGNVPKGSSNSGLQLHERKAAAFFWGRGAYGGYVSTPKRRPACVLAGPSPSAGRHGASPAEEGNTAGGIFQHSLTVRVGIPSCLSFSNDGNQEDGPP